MQSWAVGDASAGPMPTPLTLQMCGVQWYYVDCCNVSLLACLQYLGLTSCCLTPDLSS